MRIKVRKHDIIARFVEQGKTEDEAQAIIEQALLNGTIIFDNPTLDPSEDGYIGDFDALFTLSA